jgi:hypothetical protein
LVPPQSTSLSAAGGGALPLATPSAQDGTWQQLPTLGSHPVAAQTPLVQSLPS